MSSTPGRWQRILVGFLLLFAVLEATWYGLRYAGQPILERHGFRQTQTAISTYWMMKDGLSFAYETPVLGAPWAIPFELPIYQSIVAVVSGATGADLQAVGRVVSFLFFLLCVPQLVALLRILGFSLEVRAIAAILFLTAPQYVYWGRTFMIETTALFFTVAALRYFAAYLEAGERPRDLLLASLASTAALLQKVTTSLPCLGVVFLAFLFRRWGRRPGRRQLVEATALILPLLVAGAWIRYTDAVKSHNELGRLLTSQALRGWNFGSLDQRLGAPLWVEVVYERQIVSNLGGTLGLALLLAAVVAADKRARLAAASALFLFLANLLAFTNLHLVHDYYQTSVTIWLCVAVAIGLGTVLEIPAVRPLGLIALLVLVGTNADHVQRSVRPLVERQFTVAGSETLQIAEKIRNETEPESVILVYGRQWSSEIPFFAERRALAVLPWPKPELALDVNTFIGSRPELAGEQLGAIVFCPANQGKWKPPEAGPVLDFLGPDRYRLEPVGACTLLLRRRTESGAPQPL